MIASPKLNPSSPARSGPPLTAVLALSAGVGFAHLWLLSAGPGAVLSAAPGPAALALQTRTLSAQAQTQPAAPGPVKRAMPPKPTASMPPAAQAAPAVDSGSQPPSSVAAQLSLPETKDLPGDAAPAVLRDGDTMPGTTSSSSGPADAATGQNPPAEAAPQAASDSSLPTGRAPAAPVLSVPGSARLYYQVSGRSRGFEFSASAQLDWQHDGQRYQGRLMLSAFPLPSRVQTSVGELDAQGLSPRRFSDKARSEVAIHFQPDQGRIVFSNNAPQAAWVAGVQDRLSVVLQLAALLAGDPDRLTPGSRISLATAGSREIETWEFTVLRSQSLQLPLGEQAAVHMRRDPRHLYDQTIDLWFAPALGYLPVRMVLSQGNGDRIDQQLSRLEKP